MTRPTHLGRYRIVSKLGAGAMGEVYLAEDPQIHRRLALKTVKLQGSPEDIEVRKQRMLVEARAAGRLVHPHVVTLFDAGEDDGIVYLAFEYVEGQDLGVRLKNGPPLSLREALRITRQTAQALHHAHRLGIVHRDIKPSNILLTVDGEAKIGDFGIAKLHNQETELTTTGMLIGTPHYMSPEQVRGETLDGRSDVFSLGSVFFELLHSRRPFPSDTLTTLVYQILHEDPSDGLRDDLPPSLGELSARMLAKDVAARPEAGEVAQVLEALESELPAELMEIDAATVSVPSGGLASDFTPTVAADTATPKAATRLQPPTLPPSPPTAAHDQQAGSPPPAPPPVRTDGASDPDATASGATLSSTAASVSSAVDATPSRLNRWLPWAAALGCLGVLGGGVLVVTLLWLGSLEKAVPEEIGADSGVGGGATVQSSEDGSSGELGEGPADAPGEALEEAPADETSLADLPDPELRVLTPEGESEAQPRIGVPIRRTVPPSEDEADSGGESTKPTATSTRRTEVVVEEPEPDPEPPPTRPETGGGTRPARDREPAAEREDFSAVSVDERRNVSTLVGFRIQPDDAFVLFRRPGDRRFTNIGRARDYDMKRKRRGAFQLPGPGPYLVILRKEGLADYRLHLDAVAGGEASLIEVQLDR